MNRFDYIVNKYRSDALNNDNRSCHIAFLLKGRKILHVGLNQMNRNYFEGQSCTSLHAEIDCIRKSRFNKTNITKYDILIVNINKDVTSDKMYKDSRPCKHCTAYLRKMGFKSVFCSTNNGIIEKLKLSGYEPYETLASIKLNCQ
jgi:deoxycytidylate deaminase